MERGRGGDDLEHIPRVHWKEGMQCTCWLGSCNLGHFSLKLFEVIDSVGDHYMFFDGDAEFTIQQCFIFFAGKPLMVPPAPTPSASQSRK